MSSDLRLDSVMKSIDVYSRLAFGGQCVAAMALIAAPLIFIVACIVPFVLWGDDNHAGAIAAWLGGWALAIGTGAAGVGLGVLSWRWSGDWVTEWPGYAVAFGIAAIANLITAYLLTSTPVPVYGSFAVTIGAAFVAGLLVAGHLGGTHMLPDQREERERQRAIARRR
jgi:hypothetical protein